ncbi:MAG: hypothetical protein R3B68_05000 [Phycisphaerales bacterium]
MPPWSPSWTELLFQWSGLLIAALAAAWAAFAIAGASPAAILARPRRITTRRCPGRWRWWPIPRHISCWYDLTGVPRGSAGRTTCPECGSTWPERALRRRRRRWKLAAILLIPLQLAAYGVWCVPRVQREGWMGLVPTTALVLLVDEMEVWLSGVSSSARPANLRQHLYVAIVSRAGRDDMAQWQWNRLMDTSEQELRRMEFGPYAFSVREQLLGQAIRLGRVSAERHRRELWAPIEVRMFTRERWPRGTPVVAHVSPWESGHPNQRVLVEYGGGVHAIEYPVSAFYYAYSSFEPPSPSQPTLIALGSAESLDASPMVSCRLQYLADSPRFGSFWATAAEWEQPIEITIVESASEAITILDSEPLQRGLAERIGAPWIRLGADWCQVSWSNSTCWDLEHSVDWGPSLSLQVVRDGVTVASGRPLDPWRYDHPGEWLNLDLNANWIPSAEPTTNWELRIVADPLRTLADPKAEYAWEGQVTVLLRVVGSGPHRQEPSDDSPRHEPLPRIPRGRYAP